ncbi:hypothetical protein OROMI_019095 [Orobanche minor]
MQNLQKLPLKFQLIVEYLWHEDTEEQYKATRQFRELHSTEPSPLIRDFIQSGVVPRLVEFLCEYKIPSLQFEAAWALTNIASGTSEDVTAVIDHSAVPLFIMLLSSQVDYVREQAVWALGNIAADSPNHRDLVLREEAMNPLLSLMVNEDSSVHMLRIATWTLLNFCRGEPQHPFDALPTLAFLIKSNDDEEVLTNACWALSYLLDGSTDKIQAVIDSGICPRVVQLLRYASPSVLIPALRTVGNIVTGNDEQTQVIIDHQALPCLLTLLDKVYDKSIRKQACWAISNITAGNENQIQAVIDANIFGRLVDLLQNTEFEIESEAAWAISNATFGGSDDQITRIALVENCILHLCDLLDCQDPEILEVCLEALENIVKVGETQKKTYGENIFAMLIDSAGGGFIRLVNLGTCEAGEITKIRNWLLDTYWVHDNSGYLSEIATSDVPFEPILRAGATMKNKKRKFPSCSPFPLSIPLSRGIRLNGVLLRVEFKLSRDHRMVRTLNTYFEETQSCKRIKISERPSSERDHIDVIIKYYKGTVINDWTAPTTDVVDLNEPKERKILIHLPTSGASNTMAKSLSEMGAPADAYEDAMGMLTKWLMVQTPYMPLPTCLEIYDMELIDPIANRSWSFLPDRVIDSTRFPCFGD